MEPSTNKAAVLLADPNGLCLKKKGDINPDTAAHYTSMIRLVSQLQGFEQNSSVSISIETDQSTTMVKQYDDMTMVFKAPSKIEGGGSSSAPVTDVSEPQDVSSE